MRSPNPTETLSRAAHTLDSVRGQQAIEAMAAPVMMMK
jgi:hypothetical protein